MIHTEEQKLRNEAKARVGFKVHARNYFVVNITIWLGWFILRARHGQYDGFWPVYTTLGWGFGLVMHYLGVYYNSEKAINKELEKLKKERGLH